MSKRISQLLKGSKQRQDNYLTTTRKKYIDNILEKSKVGKGKIEKRFVRWFQRISYLEAKVTKKNSTEK